MGAEGKTRELIVHLLLQKLFNAQPLNGIAILFSTRERPVLKVLLVETVLTVGWTYEVCKHTNTVLREYVRDCGKS